MSSQYLSQLQVPQQNINIRVNEIIARDASMETFHVQTFNVQDISAQNILCQYLTASNAISTDVLIASTSTLDSINCQTGVFTDIASESGIFTDISSLDISAQNINISSLGTVQNLTVNGTLQSNIGTYESVAGGLTFSESGGSGLFVTGSFLASKIITGTGTTALVHIFFSGAVTSVNISNTPAVFEAVLPAGYAPANADSIVGVTQVAHGGNDDLALVVVSSGKIFLRKLSGNWQNGGSSIAAFEITYHMFT